MKQEELISCIYDFLSQLLDNKEIFPHIRKIILYGSVARGDFSDDSDIDLFIDTTILKLEPKIKQELRKFEARAEKTWALRGSLFPFKIIIDNIDHPRWKGLRQEMISYGKTVYGPFESLPQQHRLLMTYSLQQKSQPEKMAFLRHLYGYNSKKEGKQYDKKGLLEEMNGIKVEANVLLIPREGWNSLQKLCQKYKVKYTLREIWSKP